MLASPSLPTPSLTLIHVLQDRVGDFAVGKEFDALLVDTTDTAVFDMFDGDTPLDAFQKFVNLGDDRNIKAVYVKARKVK
jgi:guanine deaminase